MRLTYQSPSAVSELIPVTAPPGNSELNFRVGRSITMIVVWLTLALSCEPRANGVSIWLSFERGSSAAALC
jgi:hypothetical protein